MADLSETNDWTPGLYQLETSDPVLGGPEGVSNLQAKQLGSRTNWLKRKLESLVEKVEQATENVLGTVRIASQVAVSKGTDDRTVVTPKTLATLFPYRGRAVYARPGVYTWTIPTGVVRAWVVVIGAGGGGARMTTLPGASGGSGGGVAKRLVNLSGTTKVLVTVGAGGIGALVDGTRGGNGGASSFGTFLHATSGWGGMIDGKTPHGGEGLGGDENDCIGLAGHAMGAANNTTFLGGSGGGGESGSTWNDSRKPRTPGQGGGGRGGSAAPDGADGQVTIEW
jgi:hypothetical protein